MKYKLIQIIEELQKIVDNMEGTEKPKPKEFKPTEEQIKRWKEVAPTKKTLGLLAKKGFPSDEIKAIKTQYECHLILNNLKKENI